MPTEAERCLSNNLDWYRSVLSTHGLAGSVAEGVWTCVGEVPPYYANAMTVSATGAKAQCRAIQGLARALPRPFAVKDSFATLDLAPLGFRLLFSAEWIWLDPASARPVPNRQSWQRITTTSELAEWETAWRENGSPADRPVFLPALLKDETVGLFAWRRDGRIVAGCAGNRSDSVGGLSNAFTGQSGPNADFAAAAAAVAAFSPGRPVVGYESGDSLGNAIGLGFRPVGPLRIWLGNPR